MGIVKPGSKIENIFPVDLNKKIRLMGHHHLCAGAFEQLFAFPAFKLGYPELVARLKPGPGVLVESIFGYDIFCYQCRYWSDEEGRCSTGWGNKISKDAAVLSHLGIRTGEVRTLKQIQILLGKKVSKSDLERFCGRGEWKCEFYETGACQKGYEELRRKHRPRKK